MTDSKQLEKEIKGLDLSDVEPHIKDKFEARIVMAHAKKTWNEARKARKQGDARKYGEAPAGTIRDRENFAILNTEDEQVAEIGAQYGFDLAEAKWMLKSDEYYAEMEKKKVKQL